MLFNSYTFVAFLLAVVVATRWARTDRAQKGVLLVASYLFYAGWNPPFVLLLAISTVIDFNVGRWMHASDAPRRRRGLLLLSLSSNLGMLAYFKYANFIQDGVVALVGSLGVAVDAAPLDVVLPVGISFYTFQTLSYSIDIYRGDLDPTTSKLDFALFVSFFPQLVAGPIVRAADFLPQLVTPRPWAERRLAWGVVLIVVGLFQKVVVADALLAEHVDRVYAASAKATFVDAWVGTAAFAGQIYCDFAGYSTCAIGVALLLGFELRRNFHSPYAAVGFSDFWRRWHISLSSWLRDYLYISLGGNRHGAVRRYRNLLLTMLLGGLWHGASWRFVVWGGLHGLFLVLEQLARRAPTSALGRAGPVVGGALTLLGVLLTWVFFRADSFTSALEILRAMIGAGVDGPRVLSSRYIAVSVVTFAGLVASHLLWRRRTFEQWFVAQPLNLRAALLAVMLIAVALSPGSQRAFIYFQF